MCDHVLTVSLRTLLRSASPWPLDVACDSSLLRSFAWDFGRTTSGSAGHFAVFALGSRPTLGEDNASIEGLLAYDYMIN